MGLIRTMNKSRIPCTTGTFLMTGTISRVLALLTFALCWLASCPAEARDPVVLLSTTKGPIAIRVFAGMVPRTADNFLDLVSRGFYDNKTFHRVEGWLIQGGCPWGNGRGNYVDPETGETRFIPLEINRNLGHGQAGMVAMARSQNPNSASCQFYILKKGMPQLNGQYAVFGMVVGGMETVYRIGIGDRILSAHIDEGQEQGNQQQAQAQAPQEREAPPSNASSSEAGSSSGSSSGSGVSSGNGVVHFPAANPNTGSGSGSGSGSGF